MSSDQNLDQTKEIAKDCEKSNQEESVDAEVVQNSEELFDQLRNLLLADEKELLSKIKDRIEKPEVYARDVASILPKSIDLSKQQENGLTESLQSTIETALKISVKKDPSNLVEALFPVMGPAIRKAIAQTLNSMLQNLNQTLDNSFSVRGLKWRLEAVRTGRSFAEVILLKTLRYRVEQVFLIHKNSGLLLQHLIAAELLAKGTEVQDGDMVSSMLSAIQDFARDSFKVGQSDTLGELQIGELTVWIEAGPQALLAGVLRGTAPKELRNEFQEALEKIHLEKPMELVEFQGDASVFETVRPRLELCLQAQYESKPEKTSPTLLILVTAVSAILLALFGYWFWHYWHWQKYLEKLNSEPGIVVTSTGKQGGKYVVFGLLDPLATSPEEIRKQVGLSSDTLIVNWQPYQAIYPKFVLVRAKEILQPPASVTLNLENNKLIATGSAPHQWIIETKKWSRVIAGINSFDETGLTDLDNIGLEEAKKAVEGQYFLFENASTQFVLGQEDKLNKIVKDIKVLISLTESLNKEVEIKIFGQTDQSGTDEVNLSLSKKRADRVAELLIMQGISPQILTSIGIGDNNTLTTTDNSSQNSDANRKVSFQIIVKDIKKGLK